MSQTVDDNPLRFIWYVAGVVAAAFVIGIASYFVGALDDHIHLDGHPVSMERSEQMRSDIDEIKGDVKTLLRRP